MVTKANFALIVVGAIFFALLARMVIQGKSLAELRRDHAALREQLEQTNQLCLERERAARLAGEESARHERSELMRLRNEVSRLQEQLQRLSANPKDNPSTGNSVAEKPSPFSTFVATVQSRVPAGHTLLAGGWPGEGGRRSLFLVTPLIPEPGSEAITLETRLFEAADENLAALGLESLNNQTNNLAPGRILTAEETQSLLQLAQDTPELKLVSSPRLMVLDGQKGQASVGHMVPDPANLNRQVQVGTTLSFQPRLSPDRKSVDLVIESKVNQFNEPRR